VNLGLSLFLLAHRKHQFVGHAEVESGRRKLEALFVNLALKAPTRLKLAQQCV
jgi:hypothetical protein